jgi:hypothetical protein
MFMKNAINPVNCITIIFYISEILYHGQKRKFYITNQ